MIWGLQLQLAHDMSFSLEDEYIFQCDYFQNKLESFNPVSNFRGNDLIISEWDL